MQRRYEDLIRIHRDLKKALSDMHRMQALVAHGEKLVVLGQLTAHATHEILNSINTVSIHVQMWLQEEALDPKLRDALMATAQQVERVIRVCEGLQHLSGRETPRLERFDLNQLITGTLGLVEHGIRLENIQIRQALDPTLPEFVGDKDQLAQTILCLIRNAWDAMPEGGELTLRTERCDIRGQSGVHFRVSDTGCGIPAEHLPRIFDPFFTTKPEGKGTGLGLSICQRAAEQHGGRIWAESEVGKGTTIKIELLLQQGEKLRGADPGQE